jgi:predicted ABC-type ATPase
MTSSATPTCWIIAGPNGAGKTTFALTYLPQMGCRHFVNADLIAAGLSPLAPAMQQAAAGRLLLREVRSHIAQGHSFAVETTLAGRGYLKLVDELRAAGWRVELIYLALPDKAMSHQRVAERVARGGHDIPAADLDRRFPRSLRHLFGDFSHRVDYCRCYVNNGPVPELVFEQTGTQRVVHHANHYQQLLSEVTP